MSIADEQSFLISRYEDNEQVSSYFRPLEEADSEQILNEKWRGVFFALWERIIVTEALRLRTLKLICDGDESEQIQGLLFLGSDTGKQWSLDCLLETAPFNQHSYSGRQYRGIGKALVARMILEHWHLGHRSPLQIESSPRALSFYRSLGFISPKPSPRANRLLLMENEGRKIVEQVTELITLPELIEKV